MFEMMICGWTRTYRRIGDAAAVGRPGGRDVEAPARGDVHLARAVVIRDVDLFAGPHLDRVDDSLVGAVGDENELRSRDSAKTALGLVNLVGNRMGGGAGVPQRYVVVDAAQRDAAPADVEQPHLDLKRVARAAYGSFHHAIGAQLTPPIEVDRVGRRRLLDGFVGIARNHVVFALEVEIVPQHFGD